MQETAPDKLLPQLAEKYRGGPIYDSGRGRRPVPMRAALAAKITSASHVHGVGSRLRNVAGAARGPAAATGIQSPVSQRPRGSRPSAASRTRYCTRPSLPRYPRVSPAGIAAGADAEGRHPGRRRGLRGHDARPPRGRRINTCNTRSRKKSTCNRVGPVVAGLVDAGRGGSRLCPYTAAAVAAVLPEDGAEPQKPGTRSPLRYANTCQNSSINTKLLSKSLGTRNADDAWVAELSKVVYGAPRERAADAVAAALPKGCRRVDRRGAVARGQHVGAARPGSAAGPVDGDKLAGSCHEIRWACMPPTRPTRGGTIARASNQRNVAASLIVGAFHTAGQNPRPDGRGLPAGGATVPGHRDQPRAAARELDTAIQAKDQTRACAIATRYAASGGAPRPIFDRLLRYATSDDGALHAEKYYRTVSEEFTQIRPAFRWRQVAALARVTASEYGNTALVTAGQGAVQGFGRPGERTQPVGTRFARCGTVGIDLVHRIPRENAQSVLFNRTPNAGAARAAPIGLRFRDRSHRSGIEYPVCWRFPRQFVSRSHDRRFLS